MMHRLTCVLGMLLVAFAASAPSSFAFQSPMVLSSSKRAATSSRFPLRNGGMLARSLLPPESVLNLKAVATGGIDTVVELSKAMPKNTEAWEVHKFGGASLATSGLYKTVGDLLIKESEGRGKGMIPTMAIVSAMYGVTDQLIGVVTTAVESPEEAAKLLDGLVEKQLDVIKELAPPEVCKEFEVNIRKDAVNIKNVLTALHLIKSVPPVVMEMTTGLGEVWSAQTLLAYLRTKEIPCDWIDAREILIVQSTLAGLGEKGSSATGGVQVLWEETSTRLTHWWSKAEKFNKLDYSKSVPIIVTTGFVASTTTGIPTTLKRSGSDFSATIFARLLGAARVTMWKNTDGVYTADPRRVPDAFPIPSLKYDEAMELAYFGAQVLHPSAMVPCMDANIPVYVRNIFNTAFEGSVIQGRCTTLKQRDENNDLRVLKGARRGAPIPIKGITSIDKIALLNLEGASIIGLPGAAARFFQAMAQHDVNIVMITQASSEHSICVAVPEDQGETALRALQGAFELELARSTINSVSLLKGMSIVAIVGEGMAFTPGVSATFMKAFSHAGVNIRAIAQGSSERQVSAVVDRQDVTRALRSVHGAFTLSGAVCSVALLGTSGAVGKDFVKQLISQEEYLMESLGFSARLIVAGNSKKMAFDDTGLSLPKLDELVENGEDLDFDKVTSMLEHDTNPTRVIVDLTSADDVADKYEEWLNKGFHIVTASKKANSGPKDRFKRIKKAAVSTNSQCSAECSVGAALPIIGTLQDLIFTGDKIEKVEGVFSGTLTYIFNALAEGTKFGDAVEEAFKKGLTEPDLRDDITGEDVARKMVIIARELGLDCELEDIKVESLMPKSLESWTPSSDEREKSSMEAIAAIKKVDDSSLEKRVKDALSRGNVIRQVGTVNVKEQKISVELREVPASSSFGSLQESDNSICIVSSRYARHPLVIQGAGAGTELTASGVFADLLRISRKE